jgi:hypothetical protein
MSIYRYYFLDAGDHVSATGLVDCEPTTRCRRAPTGCCEQRPCRHKSLGRRPARVSRTNHAHRKLADPDQRAGLTWIILVMEDDELVRATVKRMLEDGGHAVDVAVQREYG